MKKCQGHEGKASETGLGEDIVLESLHLWLRVPAGTITLRISRRLSDLFLYTLKSLCYHLSCLKYAGHMIYPSEIVQGRRERLRWITQRLLLLLLL